MAYGAEPTPFVRWGREAGAGSSVDGLGDAIANFFGGSARTGAES